MHDSCIAVKRMAVVILFIGLVSGSIVVLVAPDKELGSDSETQLVIFSQYHLSTLGGSIAPALYRRT